MAEDAAWSYASPLPGGPPIKGYLAFYWHLMDAWYEEDEQVFAHARGPYKGQASYWSDARGDTGSFPDTAKDASNRQSLKKRFRAIQFIH